MALAALWLVQLALGRSEEASCAHSARRAVRRPRAPPTRSVQHRACTCSCLRSSRCRRVRRSNARSASIRVTSPLALRWRSSRWRAAGRRTRSPSPDRLERAHPGQRRAPNVLRGDVRTARRSVRRGGKATMLPALARAAGSTARGGAAVRSTSLGRRVRMRAPHRRTGSPAHPDDVAVRLVLGQANQDAGDLDAAVGRIRTRPRSRPAAVAVALNNLGLALFPARRWHARSAMAERAHAAAPDSGEVTDTLGWLLVQQQDLDRAIAAAAPAAVSQSP